MVRWEFTMWIYKTLFKIWPKIVAFEGLDELGTKANDMVKRSCTIRKHFGIILQNMFAKFCQTLLCDTFVMLLEDTLLAPFM